MQLPVSQQLSTATLPNRSLWDRGAACGGAGRPRPARALCLRPARGRRTGQLPAHRSPAQHDPTPATALAALGTRRECHEARPPCRADCAESVPARHDEIWSSSMSACWWWPNAAGRRRGCWPSEGVGVVVAQDPPAAGEGVLVQVAGLLVLAQRGQVGGEVVGRVRVSGWSSPSRAQVGGVGTLDARQRRTGLAAGQPVASSRTEQLRQLVGNVVETAVQVDGGQHVRQQLLPARPNRGAGRAPSSSSSSRSLGAAWPRCSSIRADSRSAMSRSASLVARW